MYIHKVRQVDTYVYMQLTLYPSTFTPGGGTVGSDRESSRMMYSSERKDVEWYIYIYIYDTNQILLSYI